MLVVNVAQSPKAGPSPCKSGVNEEFTRKTAASVIPFACAAYPHLAKRAPPFCKVPLSNASPLSQAAYLQPTFPLSISIYRFSFREDKQPNAPLRSAHHCGERSRRIPKLCAVAPLRCAILTLDHSWLAEVQTRPFRKQLGI